MTAALEIAQLSAAGLPPGGPDPDTDEVRMAWNLMGGELNWAALDPVCELLGCDDPERLVRGLAQIRDHYRKVSDAQARH